MSPAPLRVIQLVILTLAGLAFIAWFFATPDFHNLLERGLASLGGRAPTLFGIALVGLGHLALALALWKAPESAALGVLAWIVCALDAVLAAGAALLNAALSGFNMH